MEFPASMLVATSGSHSDVTDDRVRGCVAGFWTHILREKREAETWDIYIQLAERS
jgi:hypothetical protein